MSAIGRIGASGGVNRDQASSGLDSVGKELDRQIDHLGGPDKKTLSDRTKLAAKLPARNKKVDEVAKLYEKQFLGEMVKAMRGTVDFSGSDKPSMGENIYREQLDQQYVDSWGENGGIGLSNLIYDQMMERYFDGGAGGLKKHGPIKLSDRDVSHVSRVENGAGNAQQIPLKIDLPPGATSAQIKAPWPGEVVSQTHLGNQTAVTLQHEGGVRSTFIFDGVASSGMTPGRRFAKEDGVGTLSPEINSFFLNLHRTANKNADAPSLDRSPAAPSDTGAL